MCAVLNVTRVIHEVIHKAGSKVEYLIDPRATACGVGGKISEGLFLVLT